MTPSYKIDPSQFLSPENIRRIQGIQDSRGPIGMFSRGAPIYNGGSMAAHRGGGPQYGRPVKDSVRGLRNAISRRLGEMYGNK